MPQNGNHRAEWLDPPAEEEGLRRYVETIRERIGLVVLAVLVTTAMAGLYVFTAPKTYEARADMLVTPISGDDAALRSLPLIVESVDPTRDVETAAQFVTSLNVAERVKDEIGAEDTPRELQEKISAEPVAQSNIVAVTAEGDSPEDAQELANSFASNTVIDRTEQMQATIDDRLPSLETQLQAEANPTVSDSLGAQIAALRALSGSPDPTLTVETEADLPTSQASPRPALSIAGGIIAGLVLGIGGAFAAQVLDPRLRRETQLRRLYRLPILARIPRENSRRAARSPLGPRQVSPVVAEAYRTLRSTLDVGVAQGRGRVILVTGASPSEGKSTTAVNLASSLALAGKKVVLIEADLRRPALGTTLEVEPRHGGVVNVLIEKVRLEDALTPTPTYGPSLRVLLADYEGGWIAELFSIPAATKMIEDARKLADYVIIDSPPLNEVIDAMPLAREADDVLIVVRLGKSRIDKISQLGELLGETGITPAGFAVVGVPRPSRGEYHYYRGTAGQVASTNGKRRRRLFSSAR